MTLLRSSISSGALAMIGDAPSASVALADCVVTTVLVIYRPLKRVSTSQSQIEHERIGNTCWTRGACFLMIDSRNPTRSLM